MSIESDMKGLMCFSSHPICLGHNHKVTPIYSSVMWLRGNNNFPHHEVLPGCCVVRAVYSCLCTSSKKYVVNLCKFLRYVNCLIYLLVYTHINVVWNDAMKREFVCKHNRIKDKNDLSQSIECCIVYPLMNELPLFVIVTLFNCDFLLLCNYLSILVLIIIV